MKEFKIFITKREFEFYRGKEDSDRRALALALYRYELLEPELMDGFIPITGRYELDIEVNLEWLKGSGSPEGIIGDIANALKRTEIIDDNSFVSNLNIREIDYSMEDHEMEDHEMEDHEKEVIITIRYIFGGNKRGKE